MIQIIRPEDCNGKTIACDGFVLDTYGDDPIKIRFTDGSFIIILKEQDSYEDSIHMEVQSSSPDDYQLQEMGFITREELIRRSEAEKERTTKAWNAAQDERDRTEYARLQAKFRKENP